LPPPAFHTAAECGAPHIRKRVVILAAHPNRRAQRYGEQRITGGRPDRLRVEGCAKLRDDNPEHSDADRGGREGKWKQEHARVEGERGAKPLRLRPTWQLVNGRLEGGDVGTAWASQSPLLRVDAGSPYRVDELRAVGNAVVPSMVRRALEGEG
jgi:hypothetical protein